MVAGLSVLSELLPVSARDVSGLASVVRRGPDAGRIAEAHAFEKAALEALGAAKNPSELIVGTTVKGSLGRSRPDSLQDAIIEVKDRINADHVRQIQIQLSNARATGRPFILVVNPGTKVSSTLQDAIKDVDGQILRFDPSSKVLSPYEGGLP